MMPRAYIRVCARVCARFSLSRTPSRRSAAVPRICIAERPRAGAPFSLPSTPARRSVAVARTLLLAFLLTLPLAASPSEVAVLDLMVPDLRDLPSLQRGAKLYLNYCHGCHTLKYQRFERTAEDLGIPNELFKQNLIFTGVKIGSLMDNSMDDQTSRNWFGAPPPDLTMVTRARRKEGSRGLFFQNLASGHLEGGGPSWVYTFLRSFYVDAARPFGVNNVVFPDVGMPNVLEDLQGMQRLECQGRHACKLVLDDGGALTVEEFDQAMYDIVNFLWYTSEPSRLDRYRIGVYVLLFIVILGVFTYLLNREFWKDVHE